MNVSLPGDDRHGFASALARLTAAGSGDDLCGPFVAAVEVSGAVISTLGLPLGSQTVCASSRIAARIDEIQIDLGEGPCWDALRTRRPVLEDDLDRDGGTDWPNVREAFRALDIRALYAFPLFVGNLNVGSVDMYAHEPRQLSLADVEDVTVLAEIASRQLLRRALDDLDNVEEGLPDGPHSRREIHQASGMVAAQLSIAPDDALLLLRGRAFSSSRSVSEVAADVVARRLTFDP
ncbi:GAF and ANTAR domain-containing protein [Agromyces humi]|uniref:GAF and ANTAR domain-containing protein n=1 Tax=Agromyces humi TaxID=1766800 RepID=UPI00135C4061|nr:GAF and ANTAR domain-containing protein [Agromyces humi]